MTALLGIILIYIYSVFGFTFLGDMYFDEEINRGILNKRGDSVC